jgi:hypothetical protein
MPDNINTTINRQLYTAYDGHNLLGKIYKVIVSMAPGSILVSAFGDGKDFLTAAGYSCADAPNDHFEKQIINERLLNDAGKVSTLFLATDKGMLVPKALYKEEAAEEWFRSTYFIEKEETVATHSLDDDKAVYLFAIPAEIKDIAERYFPKAKILPFVAHQFGKNYKSGNVLQCTITPKLAFATLNKGKAVQWHQVFRYVNAEDIAYQLQAACVQNDVAEVSLKAAADSIELLPILEGLRSYYPDMYTGADTKDESWKATVNLAQQLYTCV